MLMYAFATKYWISRFADIEMLLAKKNFMLLTLLLVIMMITPSMNIIVHLNGSNVYDNRMMLIQCD